MILALLMLPETRGRPLASLEQRLAEQRRDLPAIDHGQTGQRND